MCVCAHLYVYVCAEEAGSSVLGEPLEGSYLCKVEPNRETERKRERGGWSSLGDSEVCIFHLWNLPQFREGDHGLCHASPPWTSPRNQRLLPLLLG